MTISSAVSACEARSKPIAPHFNDPQHWYQRAEEARVLAEQMSDEYTKQMMLKIADNSGEPTKLAIGRADDRMMLSDGFGATMGYRSVTF